MKTIMVVVMAVFTIVVSHAERGFATSRIVFMADAHVGEGCNSSKTGYRLNDRNCYSVRDLRAAVERVNEIHEQNDSVPLSLVLLGGDVTASAQETEFIAARRELDRLSMPYLPVMGNHDVWTYIPDIGDLTPAPSADTLFASVFQTTFERFQCQQNFSYKNVTVYNPSHMCNSTFQSWSLSGSCDVLQNNKDLQNVKVIAPDFNTRLRAPPPCPKTLPTGGCGVLGMAELFDFKNGTLDWFRKEVTDNTPQEIETVIFLIHQPFRCRFGVPDWYFCFSKENKKVIRNIISSSPVDNKKFWGVLAGHQHRWFNGTAFDEPAFKHFRQWENSAIKGDYFDSKMSSSFTVLTFEDSNLIDLEMHWRENGVWKKRQSA